MQFSHVYISCLSYLIELLDKHSEMGTLIFVFEEQFLQNAPSEYLIKFLRLFKDTNFIKSTSSKNGWWCHLWNNLQTPVFIDKGEIISLK